MVGKINKAPDTLKLPEDMINIDYNSDEYKLKKTKTNFIFFFFYYLEKD